MKPYRKPAKLLQPLQTDPEHLPCLRPLLETGTEAFCGYFSEITSITGSSSKPSSSLSSQSCHDALSDSAVQPYTCRLMPLIHGMSLQYYYLNVSEMKLP